MRLVLAFLMITILAACAPPADTPISNSDSSPVQSGDYRPGPADSNRIREPAFLESIDLLTLESHPLQFSLILRGNLPTPCHKLRASASPPDMHHVIEVDVYSVVDPGTACIAVLEPFELNFPLGSFPAGTYSILVNGERVAEFDA